jgi:hypothetical protein
MQAQKSWFPQFTVSPAKRRALGNPAKPPPKQIPDEIRIQEARFGIFRMWKKM